MSWKKEGVIFSTVVFNGARLRVLRAAETVIYNLNPGGSSENVLSRDAVDRSPEDGAQRAGLDGLILLEFHCQDLLMRVGSVVVLCLCLIHFWFSIGRADPLKEPGLIIVTVGEGHTAAVGFVMFTATRLLQQCHLRFLEFRYSWLQSLPTHRWTTLMLENISRPYCSDHAL